MNTEFENNSWIINYSAERYDSREFSMGNDGKLSKGDGTITWINTYGFNFQDEFKQMVLGNDLDDFLLRLLLNPNLGNKVIELEDQLFLAARIIKTEDSELAAEQMFFVVAQDFVWCIQEKQGDHFDWIRKRIFDNKGIIRKKKADYLLFFILETIVSNYKQKYEEMVLPENIGLSGGQEPNPRFMVEVEQRKSTILQFKKAGHALRDVMLKLENVEVKGFQNKYFSEIREQINSLLNDVESDVQELESQINLFFSIQGHRLNEVMKTLTIFSVIFIPLTFLAGIYGMNFENMPELRWPNAYFLLLGIMLLVVLITIVIFKRKKWF